MHRQSHLYIPGPEEESSSMIPIRPNRRSISKSLTLKKRKHFSNVVSNADQVGGNSISGHHQSQAPSTSLIDLKAQLFKFVVIGESGAGKSNLISRFTKNQFEARSKSTIGIDFALHTFQIRAPTKSPSGKSFSKASKASDQPAYSDDEFRAQIWDTAGQERYRSMTRLFYRDVCGALLVFDLTNRAHLTALPRWLGEIQTNQHWSGRDDIDLSHPQGNNSSKRPTGSVPIILVGNKLDRRDRQVTPEEGWDFVQRNGLAGYIETSAKTGEAVEKAFQELFEASVEHFSARKPNIHRANSFKLVNHKSKKGNQEYRYDDHAGSDGHYQSRKYHSSHSKDGHREKSKSKCSC